MKRRMDAKRFWGSSYVLTAVTGGCGDRDDEAHAASCGGRQERSTSRRVVGLGSDGHASGDRAQRGRQRHHRAGARRGHRSADDRPHRRHPRQRGRLGQSRRGAWCGSTRTKPRCACCRRRPARRRARRSTSWRAPSTSGSRRWLAQGTITAQQLQRLEAQRDALKSATDAAHVAQSDAARMQGNTTDQGALRGHRLQGPHGGRRDRDHGARQRAAAAGRSRPASTCACRCTSASSIACPSATRSKPSFRAATRRRSARSPSSAPRSTRARATPRWSRASPIRTVRCAPACSPRSASSPRPAPTAWSCLRARSRAPATSATCS